jgi:uncharacterized protein
MKKQKSNQTSNHRYYLSDVLWDCWCMASIVGIWPRFIEPNLITTKKLKIQIPHLPVDLQGFTILQFSDIHLRKGVPNFFLEKLKRKIKDLNPDMIVFTGDFLCYSKFGDKERLRALLNSVSAPHGCFAILGNHDYQKTISINSLGEYDVLENRSSMISTGFSRVFSTTILAKCVTPRAKAVGFHEELMEMIKQTPFQLLHNDSKKIAIGDTALNVCGLGEYTLGRCLADEAFKNYDRRYPGIILSHNPDSFPMLEHYPGNLILSGHTHGGQINLPWLWKKFTLLENMKYKYGLFKLKDKWAYVSRGVGSIMPFRWFAAPEIVLFTLEKE